MDREVAEKVMGLTVKPIQVLDGKGWRSDVGTVDPPRRMADGRMGVHADALPEYSTDNAAAISALEHYGKPWEIHCDSSSNYIVTVWTHHAQLQPPSISIGDTLAHAACLALLRAVGAA